MMTLTMGDNIKRNTSGLTPWNITAQMRGYKRRTRDIGHFWSADGTYWAGENDKIVSSGEAEQLFLTGIGNHVIETCGSQSVFEGFISGMRFTRRGQTSVRDLNNVINSLKLTYSRFTGNLLLNGSAEIGTVTEWSSTPGNYLPQTGTGVHSTRGDPYWDEGHTNTPYPVLSISTEWSSHGTKSFKIDCEPMFGGLVLTTGAGVTAGGKYQVKGTIYSQTATDPIYVRVRAGTSEENSTVLYYYATPATAGIYSFSAIFEADEEATGDLMISIWGNDEAIFFVDGFSLQEIGSHKETAYASVADSISLYGLQENVIVCGALGDDEAIARRDNWLNALAWPRSMPEPYSGSDGLSVTLSGYVWKLGQQSATLGGLLAASTHISNLIPLCTFLSLGYVATNSLLTYVAEDRPTRIWEAVQSVTESGGSTGEYVCGVGPNREFFYEPRSTECLYKLKVDAQGVGHWLNMDNTLAVAQLMKPGIVYFEDMAAGPGTPPGESIEDNPRYMRVCEWEYDADSDTAIPTDYKGILG